MSDRAALIGSWDGQPVTFTGHRFRCPKDWLLSRVNDPEMFAYAEDRPMKLKLKLMKDDGQHSTWIDPNEVVAVHELPPDNVQHCMICWRGGVTTVRGKAEDVVKLIHEALT
jgi:hypothetical protein